MKAEWEIHLEKCFQICVFLNGYIINVRTLFNTTNFAANIEVKDSLSVLQAKPSHFGSNNPNINNPATATFVSLVRTKCR